MYLVMEYFRLDLADILSSSSITLRKKDAIKMTYKTLCAVQFLHSANIIHSDIKPENILINNDLEIKICDFGLSRSLRHRDEPNKKIRPMSNCSFTRFYRPPEAILDYQN